MKRHGCQDCSARLYRQATPGRGSALSCREKVSLVRYALHAPSPYATLLLSVATLALVFNCITSNFQRRSNTRTAIGICFVRSCLPMRHCYRFLLVFLSRWEIPFLKRDSLIYANRLLSSASIIFATGQTVENWQLSKQSEYTRAKPKPRLITAHSALQLYLQTCKLHTDYLPTS